VKPNIEDTDIITRRVPPALPILGELIDEQLEHVIGGASRLTFLEWAADTYNDHRRNLLDEQTDKEWRAYDASEKV